MTALALVFADADIPMTAQDRIRMAIQDLPTLNSKDVNIDESCAICLNGFASILEEEAKATLQEGSCNEDVESASEFGITQLVGCGHLFCRKEYVLRNSRP